MRRFPALVLLATFSIALSPAFADGPFVEAFRVEGLADPYGFVCDPVGGGYFISNVDGAPGQKDGKGSLTRLKADGSVAAQKWSPAGKKLPTLDSPQGLAFFVPADSTEADQPRWLLIADRTRILVVDVTGALPILDLELSGMGAKHLLDLAVDPHDGTVYASDRGARRIWAILPEYGAKPRGNHPGPRVVLDLGEIQPSAITFFGTGGSNHLLVLGGGKKGSLHRTTVTDGASLWACPAPADAPALEDLRGLIAIPREPSTGELYVTSGNGSLLHWSPNGVIREVLSGLAGPADLGYDPRSKLLLVPLAGSDSAVALRVP